MKDVIYYFTGTGNSLVVAKELSMKTDIQLLPATAVKMSDTLKADSIGLVFPIYMFNAPKIIYKIVSQIAECSYCYIVMTMAGNSGRTKEKIEKILFKNSVRLHATFSILMPDNYIVWNGAISEEKQQCATEDAKVKINEIAQKIKYKEMNRDNEQTFRKDLNGPLPLKFRIIPPPIRQFLCDMGFKFVASMDKAYEINHLCNGCGICSKVCPVKNITLNNSEPIWNHQCEQCFACLQWCPQQAIEYGEKSISRKRYHHYDVTLQDMMKQAG